MGVPSWRNEGGSEASNLDGAGGTKSKASDTQGVAASLASRTPEEAEAPGTDDEIKPLTGLGGKDSCLELNTRE